MQHAEPVEDATEWGAVPGMNWVSLAWWWKRLRCEKASSSTKNLRTTAQPLDSCLPLAMMQESPAILAESTSYLSVQHSAYYQDALCNTDDAGAPQRGE